MRLNEISSLSNNLQTLLDKHNLKISHLSKEIDVTISTLSKLINRQIEDPRATTLKQIATYFNVTIDELLGLNIVKVKQDGISKQFSNIPIYSAEQVQKINSLAHVNANGHKLLEIDNSNDDYFISQATGLAMMPLFNESTQILFRKTVIANNKQFVLYHNTKTDVIALRQLLIDGGSKILKPTNPDFPIIEMTNDEKIIAVAIEIFRELE